MEVNEQLVRAVTQAVVAQLMASGAQPQNVSSTPAPAGTGLSLIHISEPTRPY